MILNSSDTAGHSQCLVGFSNRAMQHACLGVRNAGLGAYKSILVLWRRYETGPNGFSASTGFTTAQQYIDFANGTMRQRMATYIAGGGLKPLIGEWSLAGARASGGVLVSLSDAAMGCAQMVQALRCQMLMGALGTLPVSDACTLLRSRALLISADLHSCRPADTRSARV